MNCKYCGKYFSKKSLVIDHIERCHSKELSDENIDAYQACWLATHPDLHSLCMCGCGKKTDWCYATGKPHKVSNDPKCKERLRKIALANHIKVYNTPTLLNDMEHQREMQHNRPTAGKYKFSDGRTVDYLSSLEKSFLWFCDTVLELKSNMILTSPKIFTYYDPKAKKNRQYDPDFYLPDYNLLIEIKDGGEHSNSNPAFIEETRYKTELKDEMMRKQTEYNFIKIVDKNYGPFVELLYSIVHDEHKKQPNKNAFVVISEAACTDPEEVIDFTFDPPYTNIENLYLCLCTIKGVGTPLAIGVMPTIDSQYIIMEQFQKNITAVIDRDDPMFDDCDVRVFKYIKHDIDKINDLFNFYKNTDINTDISLTSYLIDHKIYFTDIVSGYTNNENSITEFTTL